MPRKIEISHRTIIFTVFFLGLLWFLYYIKDLIFELFIALLIMTILNPLVTRLSKKRIPRGVSTFLAYLIVFAVFGVAVAAIIPPLVDQTTSFIEGLPGYLANLGLSSSLSESLANQALSQLGSFPSQIAKTVVSFFSNLFGFFIVFIFAFYLLLAREKLDDQLGSLFGEKKKKEIGKTIDLLEKKLGGWARGQFLLMLIVGTATYIGLIFLKIPFALPLAILVGLFEIIPYVGPIIAAVPAVIIGFGNSTIMGLAVTALYILIQQLEAYVIVPKVMKKSVGVSPLITLLSLTIGFKVAGVVGAIISIPVVITLQVLGQRHSLVK